jgi:YidC/Oxa1 family membrane protein insertase
MIGNLFITFIYQPFLNVVVFFYWMLGIITGGKPDMGFAVILLTILIRILLLPLSLAEDKSEKERREMMQTLHELEAQLKNDPVRLRQETQKLFRRNSKVVTGELFSLFVQVAISLMLWKMFETGLPGEDLHLIYKWMPHVDTPFNLVFLGKFDLTHTNFFINFIQSIMIFIVETAAILTSPYPPQKGEVVRMQLVLPVISFLVFLRFPAGKKIFVITTLVISLILIIYKFIKRKIEDHTAELADKEKKKLEEKHIAEQTQFIELFQKTQMAHQMTKEEVGEAHSRLKHHSN